MASLAASARSVARSLDAFPKVGDDFVVRTRLGGAVTLACALSCGALFLSEAHYHLSRTQRTSLTVDSGRDAWAEKLHVELNVTFHAVPCELVSLEALDSSGDFVLDLMASHVHKWDVDTAGRRVGDAQRGRANERGGGDGGGVSGGDAAEGGRAGGGGTEGGGAGSTPGAHATPGHSTIAEFMREAFHWNRGGKAGGGGGRGRSPADEEREHAARAAAKLAGGGGSSSGGGGGREDDGTEGEEVALGAAGSRRLLARDLGGGGGGSALEIRQSMLQVDFMGELLESMGKVQADVDRMKREGGSVVGCHMEGYMEVSKLSGHIQVNPGRTLSLSNGQIVQMQLDPAGFNMSHTIHGLSFGAAYPGKVEPLSGARRMHAASGLATQYVRDAQCMSAPPQSIGSMFCTRCPRSMRAL